LLLKQKSKQINSTHLKGIDMKKVNIKILAAALLGAPFIFSAQVQAQAWPNKPIKFVVPFAAGGANDLMARAAAEGASKQLKQTILIENKPGAGGSIGAVSVAQSTPDGYTFLISAAGVISNSMIKKNNPYKDSELTPVVMIGLSPSVIVVSSSPIIKI
jgi:tripartite-type tricarboxylate transporter receptor subunit TctC